MWFGSTLENCGFGLCLTSPAKEKNSYCNQNSSKTSLKKNMKKTRLPGKFSQGQQGTEPFPQIALKENGAYTKFTQGLSVKQEDIAIGNEMKPKNYGPIRASNQTAGTEEIDDQRVNLHIKIMQKLKLVKSIYIDEQKNNQSREQSFVLEKHEKSKKVFKLIG